MNKKQGRPTNYRSEMCVILEEMMLKGASQIEVMAELNITKETFNNWINEYDEFSESLEIGKVQSQAWREKLGRDNITNPKFKHAFWHMNMKNRFLWSDKPENEEDKNVTIIVKSPIPHYPGEQVEESYKGR
jgi:hypothetical protein